MTFDETKFEWHDINQHAAELADDALDTIAAKHAGNRSSQEGLAPTTVDVSAVRASQLR